MKIRALTRSFYSLEGRYMSYQDIRHHYEDYEEPEYEQPRCEDCGAFVSLKSTARESYVRGYSKVTYEYVTCKRCGERYIVCEWDEPLPDDDPHVIALNKALDELNAPDESWFTDCSVSEIAERSALRVFDDDLPF